MDLGLTPGAMNAILVVSYLLGVALRVFWPYYLKYLETGEKFDVNFIIGQLITAVIGLFTVMSQAGFISELGLLGFFGAFVSGYGATSIGRAGHWSRRPGPAPPRRGGASARRRRSDS